MTLKFKIMHLLVVIPEWGGGGGILPGDICGHGPLDLLTFAANLGDWIAFAIL